MDLRGDHISLFLKHHDGEVSHSEFMQYFTPKIKTREDGIVFTNLVNMHATVIVKTKTDSDGSSQKRKFVRWKGMPKSPSSLNLQKQQVKQKVKNQVKQNVNKKQEQVLTPTVREQEVQEKQRHEKDLEAQLMKQRNTVQQLKSKVTKRRCYISYTKKLKTY